MEQTKATVGGNQYSLSKANEELGSAIAMIQSAQRRVKQSMSVAKASSISSQCDYAVKYLENVKGQVK